MEDAFLQLGSTGNHVLHDITARGILVKRRIGNGPIAGIVVGVCVAIGLLGFCLYPVIVSCIKRRRQRQRHARGPFDPETGEVGRPGDSAGGDGHRRLSSQDSFKPEDEITRGGIGEGSVKDLPWTPSDNIAYSHTQTQPQPGYAARVDADTQNPAIQPGSEYQTSPFPDYSGEYMPQSIGDVHNGVLNGSSADYYSPSIPSEAFGMVTTDGTVVEAEPKRSLSRGSSFRQNVRNMFRRKSTKDQSIDSATLSFGDPRDAEAHQPSLNTHEVSLQRITTGDRTESPLHVGPATDLMPPPPPPQPLGSPFDQTAESSTPRRAVQTPPQSPPVEAKFKVSPSPPSHPAPGTINPMDVMPATTDSELYHRTEYQLFMSSQSSPPVPEPVDSDASPDAPSPLTLAQNTALHTPVVQSPTPTQKDLPLKQETVEEDVAMTDIPPQTHLSPLPDPDARHPSYPSDLSTPAPGPASTNPSTLNTPATQLDSPSPNSNTSDYRHSSSPGNDIGGAISPKTGTYACDEPGCSQVFDQPHKLKHHQRYHTKDHKCTYPGCGKGFGTKTHLQRHINDRHEKKKKFHCAIPGCDYSRQGGKGFPRKDNWKRHMTKIHGLDQQNLPEPVEADQEMGGM